MTSPDAQPTSIALQEKTTIREFAEKIDTPVTQVISELMKNGVMVSMNEFIDFDTAMIIADNFGITVTLAASDIAEKEKEATQTSALESLINDDDAVADRPPVVVVMGHVDHGKTKLLDAIRETHVIDSEAGGITQHIGAYQVVKNDRLITFIDTPGHGAFTAMRSRGARVADIAVLVVAADDGVKPQTKEAAEIIKKAHLPFVVAINKIDKSDANVEKVKRELTELEIIPEEWGGKVPFVETSATTKKGIDTLLEMILLVADVERKHIRANPDRAAVGTVIESHIDKGEGPVATIVVQTGTLKVGDYMQAGETTGKIKNIRDFNNKAVREAPPSMPARILGLPSAPDVGDILTVVEKSHALAERKKRRRVTSSMQITSATGTSSDKEERESKSVDIVLKADTLSSLEAIMAEIKKLETDEVGIRIVGKSLGNITEADIMLATSSDAKLLGFNVQSTSRSDEVARGQSFAFQTYDVIYDLINAIREDVEALLSPEIIREDIGTVKILAVFRHEKKAMIVGGRVESGRIIKNAHVTIVKDETETGDGTIVALQQDKKTAGTVKAGNEFGIRVEGLTGIDEGTTMRVFTIEKRARKISND